MQDNQTDYEILNIESIIPDKENANIHDNIHNIEASLKAFGQVKPIVVHRPSMIIVAGNGTYQAAKNLGFKTIKVFFTSMPLEKARGFAIADNEISRKSHWDLDKLITQLKEYREYNPDVNWEALGFSNDQILPLFDTDINLGDNSYDTPDLPEEVKLRSIRVTEDVKKRFDKLAATMRKSDSESNDSIVVELLISEFERNAE